MMYEIIIINVVWACVVAVVMKQILAVKVADAKLRLAKAEYYRKRAQMEKMRETSSNSGIDAILEELGIDLNNPLIKKAIEHYAKKFLEQAMEKGEEEKINFVG